MHISRRKALQACGALLIAGVDDRPATLASGACDDRRGVPGFESLCFTDDAGTRHSVYVSDGDGPPVVLLHELPGLTDSDLNAARQISAYGYTVIAPLMFGKPGGNGSVFSAFSVCRASKFACNKGNTTSPQVDWLLQLTREARRRWPAGRGVGIIGMCLTGAFPIAMLKEPSVVAAVLCQPTLPAGVFSRFGWFTDDRALGVSPSDLEYAQTNSDAPLLGIRFSGDWRSRPPKFEQLAKLFGGRFYRMDIRMRGSHHSTLGSEHCGEAFDEVRAFLNRFLRDLPDAGAPPFPKRSTANSLAEVLIDASMCGDSHAKPS